MTARRKPLLPTSAELARMEWPNVVAVRHPLDADGLWNTIGPILPMHIKVHLLAVKDDREALICTIQALKKVGGYHIGRPGRTRALMAPTDEKAMAVAVAEMPAAFARL